MNAPIDMVALRAMATKKPNPGDSLERRAKEAEAQWLEKDFAIPSEKLDVDRRKRIGGIYLDPEKVGSSSDASSDGFAKVDVPYRNHNAKRRSTVRKGTERAVFRAYHSQMPTMVVHFSHVTQIVDGEPVAVPIDGSKQVTAPKDWADALSRRLITAKLAVLSYRDENKNGHVTAVGMPNPAGPDVPPSAEINATPSGLLIRFGNTVEFYGRGEAHPAMIRLNLTSAGFRIPTELSDPVLKWLIELVSTVGGSSQLGARALAQHLRSPAKLRSMLMKRAGGNEQKALRSLAARLPIKKWSF